MEISQKSLDLALLEEDWAPPTGWTDRQACSPCPADPRPQAAQKWLMHLWDRPHASTTWIRLNKLRVTFLNMLMFLVSTVQSRRRMRAIWLRLRIISGLSHQASNTSAGRDVEVQDTVVELPLPRIVATSASPQHTNAGRGQFFIRNTPKRLRTRLEGHSTMPPYGWGLVFDEGIVVPLYIKISLSVSIIAITVVLSVVSARLSQSAGYEAFGLGSFTLAAVTILLTFVLR